MPFHGQLIGVGHRSRFTLTCGSFDNASALSVHVLLYTSLLQETLVLMAILVHEIFTARGVMRNIRLGHVTSLEAATLDHAADRGRAAVVRPLELVLASLDCKVGKRDLVGVSSSDGRETEK